MKTLSLLAAVTLALGLATAADAAGPRCATQIEAMSGGHQSLTNATDGATPSTIKRAYARAFAAARTDAIAAWSAKARQRCGAAAGNWNRAREKSVRECDRAMGGRFSVCAKAIPRG